MSFGFWIFLSTGLVCALILVIFSWKFPDFKKKVTLGGAAIAVLLACGGLLEWVYDKWDARPRPLTQYAGIPLEATRNDVLFLHGKPMEDHGSAWKYDRTINSGESVKRILLVFFDDEKVTAVIEFGEGEVSNGIRAGDDYGSLIARLGNPDLSIPDDDQTGRELVYRRLNSVFVVRQGVVRAVGMLHPGYRSVGKKESAAK